MHLKMSVFRDIAINTNFAQVLRAKNEIMVSIRAALAERS